MHLLRWFGQKKKSSAILVYLFRQTTLSVKTAIFALLVCLLIACETAPIISEVSYDRAQRQHLYDMDRWSFQGRLALRDEKDSWSANILWRHQDEVDSIKLSGPLGQGAIAIVSAGNHITVDRGNGDSVSSNHPEELIRQNLGVFIPIQALRFWVLGLPGEVGDFQDVQTGFIQAGWLVSVLQYLQVDNELMPRKILIANQQTKMKLIIDQWVLHDRSTE